PFFGSQLQNWIVTYAQGKYLIASCRYATSMSADTFMFSSIDGTSWSTNVLGNRFTGTIGFRFEFFMTGNNYVIASGYAFSPFLLFSTNTANWSASNGVPVSALHPAYAGAFGNGNYVVVASGPAAPSPIFTSTDGLNW